MNKPQESSSHTRGLVLQDNVFQTSTTTDSSLYSFLDVDGDDDIIFAGNTLRHFYRDQDNSQITEQLNIPEKQYSLFLVEKVIKFLGQEYYLFSPTIIEEIEALYKEDGARPDSAWMAYFFILLAIGQQYLDETHARSEVPGISYFNTSTRLMDTQSEEPTIQKIQTLLLVGFYQQGLNRSITAFTHYGCAVRMSLAMGLHRRMKSLPLEEQEQRRRLWWTCFCMDTVWTAKLGQPVHVEMADITVDTSELITLNDGFNSEILRANVQLAVITGDIMKTIYRPTVKKTIDDLLSALRKLGSFQKNLPPRLKSSIIVHNDRTVANLYLRLNQIVIITIRPLVLSVFIGQQDTNDNSTEITQAIKRCVGAACANINILFHLKEVGMFSKFGFWDARYLFSSLLVLYMSSTDTNLIPVGRDLNRLMSEAGNFTAIENEIRLRELDSLFEKFRDEAETEAKLYQHSDAISPNTILLNEISNIFTTQEETDDEFLDFIRPFSKEVSPEVWKNLTTNLQSWDSTGYV